METDIIRSAEEKKFSEFSKSINDELKDRLAAHPEVAAYSTELERIETMKGQFAEINADA